MPSDGQKALAAVAVAVLEDIDGCSPLASDAEPFDI
jgi:hypothetical protein